MTINQAGIDLIKEFEGCKLEAYKDAVGVLTVGYGHTGSDVKPGMIINQAMAQQLLVKDLEKFETGVEDLVRVGLADNEFSALVCFAYNVGLHNLEHSHLLLKVNLGDMNGAADEFLKWSKAGGEILPGLLRRRQAERALFLT